MQQRKKSWSAFFVSLTIVLGLIVLHIVGVLRPLEYVSRSLFTFIPRNAYLIQIRLRDVWGSIFLDQQAEMSNLRARITQLESDSAACKLLQEENSLLRSQLDIPELSNYKLVAGRVIGEEPDSFSRNMLINIGSRDNIEVNQPVIFNNALVGYIANVEDNLSEVILITDPNSTLYAYIQGVEGEGLVTGSLGLGYLTMEQIARESEVNIGDYVYTSGQVEPHYRDILIGRVDQILTEDRDTFQTVTVEPNVDLRGLEIVFVIQE